MRIVAVTRILNEDDIVEAFVRHHAVYVSQFVFFDNGSTDRTLQILARLAAEGIAIEVIQNTSVHFDEQDFNTWLYYHADATHRPDWVLCLDTDEFITSADPIEGDEAPEVPFADHLARLSAELPFFAMRMINFVEAPDDDPAEVLITRRQRWRRRAAEPEVKICLRGGLSSSGLTIAAGNHNLIVNGYYGVPPMEERYVLAHYYSRSPWHGFSKSTIGRLKVLAAGQLWSSTPVAQHYRPIFETLRDDPARLLLDPGPVVAPPDPDTHLIQPMAYQGGALRYTLAEDPRMRAVRLIMRYAEALALHHGKLIDEVPGAREIVGGWNAERTTLF